MTSSFLLLVTIINFSYILMPVFPSNMQRSFHNNNNNNKSSNKTKQNNNKQRTLLCTTVSTGFTYIFSVHFIAVGVYCFVSCCVIAVLCCVMLCYVVLGPESFMLYYALRVFSHSCCVIVMLCFVVVCHALLDFSHINMGFSSFYHQIYQVMNAIT